MGITGVVVWILALVPPLSSWAQHYQFVQAIQFSVFAYCVPVLLVASAPWRRIGLARNDVVQLDVDGAAGGAQQLKLVDRAALHRSASSRQQRTVTVALIFALLTVLWRIAPAVDFLVRHTWLAVFESLSLIAVGTLLFTDVIESPPLTPGVSRPYRISIAAGVMWAAWVTAYLSAMSRSSWYTGFHHVAGRGLSLAADQQFSAGFLWFVSAAVFVPIIFWNLIHWLQAEEDPNEEMGKLLREERTRRFFGTN